MERRCEILSHRYVSYFPRILIRCVLNCIVNNKGLGSRGQRTLSEFGVWKEVEAVSTAVVGRMDWSPGMSDGWLHLKRSRSLRTLEQQTQQDNHS